MYIEFTYDSTTIKGMWVPNTNNMNPLNRQEICRNLLKSSTYLLVVTSRSAVRSYDVKKHKRFL